MTHLPDNGPVIAEFDDAALEFSLRALLRGYLAPTRVILLGPEFTIIRGADGTVGLDFPTTSDGGKFGNTQRITGHTSQCC